MDILRIEDALILQYFGVICGRSDLQYFGGVSRRSEAT